MSSIFADLLYTLLLYTPVSGLAWIPLTLYPPFILHPIGTQAWALKMSQTPLSSMFFNVPTQFMLLHHGSLACIHSMDHTAWVTQHVSLACMPSMGLCTEWSWMNLQGLVSHLVWENLGVSTWTWVCRNLNSGSGQFWERSGFLL